MFGGKKQENEVEFCWIFENCLTYVLFFKWRCTNWFHVCCFNQCMSLILKLEYNWKQKRQKHSIRIAWSTMKFIAWINEHAQCCEIMWWLMHNCINWSAVPFSEWCERHWCVHWKHLKRFQLTRFISETKHIQTHCM